MRANLPVVSMSVAPLLLLAMATSATHFCCSSILLRCTTVTLMSFLLCVKSLLVYARRPVSMSEKMCVAGQPGLSAKGQPRSMGPPTTVWFKVCCHSAVIHSFIGILHFAWGRNHNANWCWSLQTKLCNLSAVTCRSNIQRRRRTWVA